MLEYEVIEGARPTPDREGKSTMAHYAGVREAAKKYPIVYDALRKVKRRAMFVVYGRDFRTESALRLFAPNSEGGRSAIADLTIQSANQTFPLLAQFAGQYCDRRAVELTAKEFWQQTGSSVTADTLRELFNTTGSDKSTHHDYHYVYAPMLASPANVRNILEIGLGTNNTDVASHMGESGKPGASLRAFRDFLPNAQIYGADVDKRILFQEDRIHTFFVDQTDIQSFGELARLNAMFDLIIDDGLHSPNANIAVLLFGLRKIIPGGWLVVEDIDQAARPVWQVFSSLLPAGYKSYLIDAKNGLVFAVQREVEAVNALNRSGSHAGKGSQ